MRGEVRTDALIGEGPINMSIKTVCRIVFFPITLMVYVVRFVEWLVTDSDWDEV
jgi:hypothetical protein